MIEYVGRHLGKSIAIAINLFNPQKVVIAGEITEADKILLPALQSCINAQVLKDFRRNLPIVTSELDHRSAIGALRWSNARCSTASCYSDCWKTPLNNQIFCYPDISEISGCSFGYSRCKDG